MYNTFACIENVTVHAMSPFDLIGCCDGETEEELLLGNH